MAPGLMRRMAPLALLLATALLATVADASAQLPAALRDGRRVLSFGALTGGGGIVGYSVMTSSRNAFTIDFMADGSFLTGESSLNDVTTAEQDAVSFDVFVAPGFRRYMAGRGDVASYVAARALLGFEGQINESTDGAGTVSRTESWAPVGGAAVGFGFEWFVTDEMSLRGEVALDGTYTYRSQSASNGSENVTQVIDFGLGQSAIVFSIWF